MLFLRDRSTLRFLLTVFQNRHPRTKDHFNAKRRAGVLGIQALQPPLQMSTFPHSHGERKEEMPPLSRAKCLQLISLSPNAPLLHYTAQRSHPRTVFQQRVVTNSENLNVLNFESSREKIRNKSHKKPQTTKDTVSTTYLLKLLKFFH